MLIIAVSFFILAAFLGTFLLRAILKNKRTYKPVVFMHGSMAGLAILVLATYIASGHTAPLLITSVVLFILAAIGGITMFTLDVSGKKVPKMIAIVHPIVALSGLGVLITYILQNI